MNVQKKVIVIGGGIAGLSAGIYAKKSGFEVTILERRSNAGGNCTSWKRGDYFFEGCMHWLCGSNKNEFLYKLWRHVGALDDSVTIQYPEPFREYDHVGTPIRLYRNVDITERELLELSPIDAKVIKELCKNIRKLQKFAVPVTDLRGVKATKKTHLPLSFLFSLLSAARVLKACSNIPSEQYIERFTHEGIRNLLRFYTNDKSSILPLLFTMSVLARGDGGFPEGGSRPFVERIVKTFQYLGGEILYDTKADRVIIENGKTVGVMVGSKRLKADAVIITTDTMTIDQLFNPPLKSLWLDEMCKETEPVMATTISLGISVNLENYPKGYIIKLRQPIELDMQTYECLNLYNYASDSAYSPKGKTAITIQLDGNTYNYWKKAKEENRYDEEKQKIAEKVIAALTTQMPEIAGRVEVCDVATPLTYERHLGNWKGSFSAEATVGKKAINYPSVIKGLSGVYFAGKRLLPPGSLPQALISGRTAVQYLCRDTGTLFVSEE